MKELKIISLYLLVLFFFSCDTGKGLEYSQQIIGEITKQHRPDKRVAIFDITPQWEEDVLVLQGETNLPKAKSELLQRFEAEGIAIRDDITLLPHKDLGDKIYGIAKVSASHIRSAPKHSAELATEALLGTILNVYKKKDNWYRVQTPGGYLGWINEGEIVLMDKNDISEWKAADKVVFLHDMGITFVGGAHFQPVSDAIAGNIFLDLGKENGYQRIGYPDMRTALVHANDVMPYQEWLDSRMPSVGNVLGTAKAMTGRPYLWGGTTGKGMDCSGFTKMTFFLNGIILPRDASQQVHVGREIDIRNSFDDLLPGDLLFFGKKATSEHKEKIRHVAIYLGSGKFIHAGEDNGYVKTESLDSDDADFAEHRLESLLRAKRLLDNVGENGVVDIKESEMY